MESLKEDILNIWNESQQLVEKRIEVTKLEIVEKSVATGGVIISMVLIVGVCLIFFFLLGVSLALWIGQLMDNYLHGALLTSAFFLVLMIILIVFRYRLIVNPFKNRQLGKYLEDYEQTK